MLKHLNKVTFPVIVNFNEIPSVNKLFKDYIHHYRKVKDFFHGDPFNLENHRKIMNKIKKRKYNREILYSLLSEKNTEFGCSANTLNNIELLTRNNTFVAIGGQQVGVLGGPLYTFYKALTTIKLAQKLTSYLRNNVIPIFWLASDDHDFSEISHINIIDKNNQIAKLNYSPKSYSHGYPMYALNLQYEIDELIEKINFCTYESEFKNGIMAELKNCYNTEATISKAFGKWLAKVFSNYGLVIIDPSHDKLKNMGSYIFKKEIEFHLETKSTLNRTNQQLKASAYHNQVECNDQSLNLFLNDNGRRIILKKRNEKFGLRGSDKEFSSKQIINLIDEHPEYFSPNALLRPLFQDYCLPTIAYVAGPDEIAYFAQLKSLYKFFNLTMPIIFPRVSITLIEKKISKILIKQKIEIKKIVRKPNETSQNLIKNRISKPLKEILNKTQSSIEQNLQKLKIPLIQFDPNLKDILDKSSSKIQFELKWVEKKVLQAHKKQHQIVISQIDKIKNHLFPHQHLQERYLSWVPYLIKYGWGFTETILNKINLKRKGHQFLEIDYSPK